MALARVKTWSSGEVLTASDLNTEFNNLLNNARDLISPLTSSLDMNGFELILDADADSSLTADTDDRLDVRLGGVDLFVFNGTTTSCVNGLTLFGTATGTPAYIRANGSDSNTGLDLRDANGNEIAKFAAVASAVNELTVTNAATGNGPSLAATGETNVPITLSGKGTGHVILGQATSTDVRLAADQPIADSSGNEFIKFSKAATAVNEVTVANAATGGAPVISATGGDTNIPLRLTPKGTGDVQMTDGTDPTKIVALEISGVTTGTTRSITMPDANVDLQYARASSDTIAGGIEIATQAEQEAGTDTGRAVTPGRQHFHPSAVKAWAVVTVSAGTPAVTNSYNVTSVDDTGLGDLTINLTTAFSATDLHCPIVQGRLDSANAHITWIRSKDEDSLRAVFALHDNTAADPAQWFYHAVGDMA